jgi:predicted Fe-Mo cluster-binding NifX family protein
MKIAIPIVDIDLQKNSLAASLSVLGSLCLYDSDKQSASWMKSLDLAPNMGELLPALGAEKVSVIISQQVHPMALKVLVNSGFVVYKANGRDVDENLKLWATGQLLKFNMESAMEFADVCGGACDSCVDECKTEKSD